MDRIELRIPAPTKALLAFLIVGTVAFALAMTPALDGAFEDFANDWLYYLVLGASAGACLSRAALVRRDRLAWLLIGVGGVSWLAGDLVWDSAYSEDPNAPYPSIADVLYLIDYPLLGAGVLLLARNALVSLRPAVVLDGAIAGLGAAAIGVAAIGPAFTGYAKADLAEAVVIAAYPIGDVLIVGAAAAAAVVLGWRRDFVLLALGLIAMAAADGTFLYQEATTGYEVGTVLDAGWPLAATFIGIAAWQPPGALEAPHTGVRAVALPGVISLLSIGLLVYDHFDRLPAGAVVLAAATLVLAVIRLAIAFGENSRLLRAARGEALTDALTGLNNRRALIEDLERSAQSARAGQREFVFAIFDLDGFKAYNDSFGHAAGDLLLRRMGAALADAVAGRGRAYRLGGDEFCILAPLGRGAGDPLVAAARAALREDGWGFEITSSHGQALIPAEAAGPTEALRIADRRLYAEKGRSSRSFAPQARDLLLGVLREREPDLHAHLEDVGELAAELARRRGLDPEQIDVVGRAADLHDVGKMAIPDEILNKPGPLDDEEWELMRKHTLIGERMLSTSPALAPVARLVRSSHERWDGAGYPDGLAGERIPVGARIISICDAFEAMTEERPYRESVSAAEAVAELRRNAGSQFDPELVELFAEVVSEGRVTAVTKPF